MSKEPQSFLKVPSNMNNIVSWIYLEDSSSQVFADIFRNVRGHIGPYRTKRSYGKRRQVVNLDINRHLCCLLFFKHK